MAQLLLRCSFVFYFFLKLLNADISEKLEILGLAPRGVRRLAQD
jgi:hypothetical protein